MKSRHSQTGFSIVELLVVVAVLALIGFVGYRVYSALNGNNTTADTTQVANQSSTANDVTSAPAVNSTSNLDDAQKALDQTDPGGSNNADAGQLNSELAAF